MSSFAKRGLGSLSFVVAVALLPSSGCSATPKGSLMLAISTDMQTPKDISLVSIYISEGSSVKFDYVGRVLPDGTVSLPSTLALVEPDDPSTQVQIRVIGFSEKAPQVLRDVETTVPHARTALLRLPLNFLDLGSVTGQLPPQYYPTTTDGVVEDSQFDPTDPTVIVSTCDPMHVCQTPGADCKTMINGQCTTATVVSSMLPVYTPTEVYGDGGIMANGAPESCFPVQSCFADATPVGVGSGTCSFTLPNASQPLDAGVAPAADGGGSPDGTADSSVRAQSAAISLAAANINVALVTQSTGACLAPGQCYVPLPNDAIEGWTLQGNTVTLAPGPCMKLGSTVTLTVSGACATDTISEPVCEPTTAAEVAEAGAAPVVDASSAPCDGNYVITCVSSATCGSSSGGSAALNVSGTQATLYAPMNNNQIVPITGSVDTATCVATITLPGSEGGSCDNASGVVMAGLTSGASFPVPCTNGGNNGSCVQGTMLCTAARGTLDASAGAPLDSGGTACASGMSLCGDSCVDEQSDPNNCGGCGISCAGSPCVNAQCINGTPNDGGTIGPSDATVGTGPSGCSWVSQGISDCPGMDNAAIGYSTASDVPDPGDCTPAGVGLAAVCWDQSTYTNSQVPGGVSGCTYKTNTAASCTGGGNPGYLYACTCGGAGGADTGAAMVCTGGTSLCNGVCIDTSSDPNNCGGCSTACSGTCTGSRCLVQLASVQGHPMGLAVDSVNVYFSGFQVPGIFSVPIGGGAPVPLTPLETETGLAVTAPNLYWTGETTGWVNSIPVAGLPDGGTPMEFFSSTNSGGTAQGNQIGLALDSTNVYWAYDDYTLGPVLVKAPLGGGQLTTLATGVFPGAVAVDATNVYVWSNTSLVSVPIDGLPDGGTPNGLINAGSGGTLINEIAVDATNIYWAGPEGVMSAPLAGGPASLLAADPDVQGPLAIDCPQPPGACQAMWVYWSGGPCTSTADGSSECAAGSILKVPAGGGAAVTLVPSAGGADIVTDSTSVYFTEYGNQAVMKLTPK